MDLFTKAHQSMATNECSIDQREIDIEFPVWLLGISTILHRARKYAWFQYCLTQGQELILVLVN